VVKHRVSTGYKSANVSVVRHNYFRQGEDEMVKTASIVYITWN